VDVSKVRQTGLNFSSRQLSAMTGTTSSATTMADVGEIPMEVGERIPMEEVRIKPCLQLLPPELRKS